MPVTRLRRSMTRLLGSGHLVFCIAWVLPLHGAPRAGVVSVVHQLAANGPIWAAGFGVTAVLLIWAAAAARPREKLSWWGHASGVVVTMAYAGASGASAALSDPLGSFVPALAFLVLSTWHLLMQRYYKAKAGG